MRTAEDKRPLNNFVNLVLSIQTLEAFEPRSVIAVCIPCSQTEFYVLRMIQSPFSCRGGAHQVVRRVMRHTLVPYLYPVSERLLKLYNPH
jgi:hypothetical protein